MQFAERLEQGVRGVGQHERSSMNEIKVFFILLKKLLISPLPIMSRAVLVYKVADEVILREKRLASKVEPARSSQQGRASKVE
jgi:hypothetical protein